MRGTAILALALACTLALGAVGADGADPGPAVPTTIEVQRPAEKVEAYWTPARIRSAAPAEELVSADDGDQLSRQPQAPEGPAGSVPPEPPAETAAAAASSGAGGGSGLTSTGGGASYTRQQVADASAFPARVHGKVLFTIPGEGNFACSGTVISSALRNLVLTAGHCVYDPDTGQFATNWLFIPGYRDGDAPYGTWAATKLATTGGWESGDQRFDVAAATLETEDGSGIQDAVGARGIRWNQPRNQLYRSFGYPAVGPAEFTGGRLFKCDSSYAFDDTSFPSPRPFAMGCDMTGGSSGGGWVVDDKFVNGVNDYYYNAEPPALDNGFNESEVLYSPYFGNAVASLYAELAPAVRCHGSTVTHLGTSGRDDLVGTSGADVFKTKGGDDRIFSGGGPDVICSGGGDDLVVTGSGPDIVYADGGADTVRGGRGEDGLYGGPSADILRGQAGSDAFRGGRGFDLCAGGAGFDRPLAPGCERIRGIP